MMLLKMIELNQDKQIIYLVASGLLILAIIAGINMMSKVEHAKNGNRLGAVSSLLAVVLVMWSYDILSFIDLWIALLIGLVVGMIMAAKVKMIQMPQMVALLNGLGGLASSIAGGLTLYSSYGSGNYFVLITAALAVIIGGITFFGSMIAAGKLHGLVPSKPVHLKNHNILNLISLIVLVILMVLLGFDLLPSKMLMLVVLLASVVMSYIFGYLFTIRVGGADMPITISLLNAFSGLSGAIAGLAIYDLLLVA
ncbi:MAG: NAD(P)(+) transhydrogenase (Re/Si-specific) subunit beta, partial [Clostridiales bacterium]|nr:NAD(P)(+) transhydrogenase (Re/Si-specific) subunit beta [Clostridiales bacterium]